ncbi:MAG: mitochondrial inner rane protease subunit 1, partial [Actinomycetota bacterium]|nr:mitochondrial inner rane protease subunit 1 [Actinomycetota bacterium]
TLTTDIARQRVPDDRFWVMGDNRPVAEDSRQFGPIPESAIEGRVLFRVWPPSGMGGIRT